MPERPARGARCDSLVVLVAFLTLPLLVGQIEHKVMAHMQARVGPMYAGGFHGWAQLVADGVKFAQKEDIVPAAADPPVFRLAPAVALIPYLVVMVAIPSVPGSSGRTLDAGVFFVLAVMGVGVIGTLMAGWASANKYSLLGAVRQVSQLMAYELPFVLAAASVVMAAGSLRLHRHRRRLAAVVAGLAAARRAVVFFVAGLAELNRPPFDMPVADAEIIFGPYTEYTGLRFALFLLAEYAGIVVLCLLTAVLFLGGWHGPFGDSLVLDARQGGRPGLRRDLAAGQLPAAARRPAAEARLAGAHPGRARSAAAHRGGDGRMVSSAREAGRGVGLVKGLGVTLPTMTRRSVTEQYPDVKPELPPRSRGVIALLEENCTVLHAVCPRVPGLVHLHRLAQRGHPRTRGRADASAPATSSTASRSTSRSACTAASASRSARSTRCSGRRSSSTPSSTSAT